MSDTAEFVRYTALACILFAPACAKHYPVRGMILAVNAPEQTVTISHRDIPRYMPAMSMPFHVRKPAEFANLQPGEQVEFDLVARRSGSYIQRLRRIGGSAVIEDQGDRIVLPPIPTGCPSARPCRTSHSPTNPAGPCGSPISGAEW